MRDLCQGCACGALGVAAQLRATGGTVPPAVLSMLNDGSGAHSRLNAYRYSRTINKELAVIGRLRELQQRAIALIGSGILALLVGLANHVANLLSSLTYYVLIDGDRA